MLWVGCFYLQPLAYNRKKLPMRCRYRFRDHLRMPWGQRSNSEESEESVIRLLVWIPMPFLLKATLMTIKIPSSVYFRLFSWLRGLVVKVTHNWGQDKQKFRNWSLWVRISAEGTFYYMSQHILRKPNDAVKHSFVFDSCPLINENDIQFSSVS